MAKTLTNQGFFLSPLGKLVPVDSSGTHIGTVISNPKAFKISPDLIKSVYKKNREKVGTEGKSRDEILKGLTTTGWIRLRRYPNRYWSIQFDKVNPRVRKIIVRWATAMLKGQGGYKEKDKYMPVIVMGFNDGFQKKLDINDIAKSGTIGEGLEVVDIENFLAEDLQLESWLPNADNELIFRWDK